MLVLFCATRPADQVSACVPTGAQPGQMHQGPNSKSQFGNCGIPSKRRHATAHCARTTHCSVRVGLCQHIGPASQCRHSLRLHGLHRLLHGLLWCLRGCLCRLHRLHGSMQTQHTTSRSRMASAVGDRLKHMARYGYTPCTARTMTPQQPPTNLQQPPNNPQTSPN